MPSPEQPEEEGQSGKVTACSCTFLFIVIIIGIIAYSLDFGDILALDRENNPDHQKAFKFAVYGLTNLIISVVIGIPNNWYQYQKNHLDPRLRKKIAPIFSLMTLMVTIWYLVYFSVFIGQDFFNFPMEDFSGIINVYLHIVFILSCIQLFLVSILVLFGCCVGCFFIYALMEGMDPHELNPNNSRTREDRQDPGVRHQDRTKVDTFAHFMSVLGLADKVETECTICLEPFNDEDTLRKLPCLHFFHKDCVDQWISNHSRCPICKQTVKDGKPLYQQVEV